MLSLLLAACGGSDPAKPPIPAPPAAEPTVPASHADGAHGHGASHGGVLKELDNLHVEGLAMPDGVLFWPTDGDARSIPPTELTGNAVIKGPAGVEQVPLVAMSDHLHAPAKLVQGQPATIVVTLTRNGRAQSATFEIASVGLGSHDHTALHGGQVGMWGEHHVEYVGGDGEYRVWVSDATRQAVKSGLAGAVRDGDTILRLTLDPATGLLSAKGEGVGTRPVTVDVTLGATNFTLGFNAVSGTGAAGPAALDQGAGLHAH